MTRCGFTVRASASRLYGGTVVSTRRADVQPAATGDVSSLPLAPKNPLPYRQRLAAVRSFHTGMDKLRDAGGLVTRVSLVLKVADSADRCCGVAAGDSRRS